MVVVVYEARIVGGEARPTPEALEVRTFRPDALPWSGIGLDTTRWALRDWVRARGIPPGVEPVPLTLGSPRVDWPAMHDEHGGPNDHAQRHRTRSGGRRQLAVDLFNHVWTLLEIPDRSPDQDDEMLHAAHASRYHWGEVGDAAHRARGEWQCSRVYSVLGRGEPALHHARRCLELCQANGLGDWDLAAAWEAVCRASLVAGDRAGMDRALEQGRIALGAIEDPEDRRLIEADLEELRTAREA